MRVGFTHAAYCDQSPWITNETAQRNILGTSLYEKQWYDQVVEACVLSDDLQALPRRDQEIVGTKGMNLSGGQQARLVCIQLAPEASRPQLTELNTAGPCKGHLFQEEDASP